ncbi:MAG TPA: hypothetical protein VMD51_12240 [Mycobacterium sp.]|nr:hypothetical protein [Mycobacterium sp.]
MSSASGPQAAFSVGAVRVSEAGISLDQQVTASLADIAVPPHFGHHFRTSREADGHRRRHQDRPVRPGYVSTVANIAYERAPAF